MIPMTCELISYFPILSALPKLMNMLICWIVFVKSTFILSCMIICQKIVDTSCVPVVDNLCGFSGRSSLLLGGTNPALANSICLR